MMEWLLAPIDPSRAHEVGFAISWHGRSMVLAWGVLAPMAVLMARFFKVMPGQDWPRELDNQTWWISHWAGHSLVALLSAFGVALVLPEGKLPAGLHNWLGYALIVILALQILLGIFRGTKGGPTAPARDGSVRGDHYDMTAKRRHFELAHKSLGYAALCLAVIVLVTGLWKANAPVWMWIVLSGWWGLLLIAAGLMQARGKAIDTYQAIWGDDPKHPGNQIPPAGWGAHRPGEKEKGNSDVRSDRRHRVRGS